jgi:hypothetical protein
MEPCRRCIGHRRTLQQGDRQSACAPCKSSLKGLHPSRLPRPRCGLGTPGAARGASAAIGVGTQAAKRLVSYGFQEAGLYRLVDMFNGAIVGAGPIASGPGGYGLEAVDVAAKLYGDDDIADEGDVAVLPWIESTGV